MSSNLFSWASHIKSLEFVPNSWLNCSSSDLGFNGVIAGYLILYAVPVKFCFFGVFRVIVLRDLLKMEKDSKDVSLHFTPFIFTSTLTCFPVPAYGKSLHGMMLSPPCLTVGTVFSAWCVVFNLLKKKKSCLTTSFSTCLGGNSSQRETFLKQKCISWKLFS